MEVGSRDWVVMTSDGEFLHVPKQHHHVQPGDEVIVPDTHVNPVWKWSAIAFAAAAFIACIFLLLPWMIPSEAKAETYVYIDMNPSLELGINSQQEVVMVRPLNQSARHLIRGMDWQRQNIQKFVVSFLERARDLGYIRGKEGIVLSGVSEKGSVKPLLEQIRQEIRHQPHLATTLNVYTLPLPKELRDKAEGTGLSLGKYAVWLLAKREGAPISTTVVANASISQLMNQLKSVEPVLTDPPPEKQWEDWLQESSPPTQSGDQVPQDSGDTEEPPAQSEENPAPVVTEPSPSDGAATDSPQTSEMENPSNSAPDNGQTTAPSGDMESSSSNQNDTGAADDQGSKESSGGDGGQGQKDPQAQPTNPPADSANDTGQDDGAHTDQTEGAPSSSAEPLSSSAMCFVVSIPLP
jgi:hypothetical protein